MSDIDRSGDIGLDGEIGARDQFLFHGEGEVGVGGSRGPTGLASEGGGGVNLVVHVESKVLQVRLENVFGAGRDDIVQGGNVRHAARHAHRDALDGVGGGVEGGGRGVVHRHIDAGHNLRCGEFRLQQIAVCS